MVDAVEHDRSYRDLPHIRLPSRFRGNQSRQQVYIAVGARSGTLFFIDAKGREGLISGLAVNGHDLVAAGIPAGREMGRVLTQLLELVLTAPKKNVPATLIEEARRWV